MSEQAVLEPVHDPELNELRLCAVDFGQVFDRQAVTAQKRGEVCLCGFALAVASAFGEGEDFLQSPDDGVLYGRFRHGSPWHADAGMAKRLLSG